MSFPGDFTAMGAAQEALSDEDAERMRTFVAYLSGLYNNDPSTLGDFGSGTADEPGSDATGLYLDLYNQQQDTATALTTRDDYRDDFLTPKQAEYDGLVDDINGLIDDIATGVPITPALVLERDAVKQLLLRFGYPEPA